MTDSLYNAGGALIVGAGVAGLFAALKLAPRPVTIISPEPLGHGASSTWAQGGVAASVGDGDDPALHAKDTITAGAGSVDASVAKLVTGAAPGIVEDLAKLGVPFDRAEDGGFVLSREAAHGMARVVRVGGDGAGRAIMNTLIAAAEAAPSIRVVEGLIAVDLLVEEGRVRGVVCRRAGDRYSSPIVMRCEATLLAAGGLGGLYGVTTNPARVRGQAIGMAARAGAEIADAEFVQFHPTALDVGVDPAPLASEALRGEGAVLLDQAGERFMAAIHPDAELAPRDIVARAVFEQATLKGGAFLDTRSALSAKIDEEFPTVAAACRAAGVDPTREPIPIAPAAHYHMGGVASDAEGRSSLRGLWVAGEAASTGLHGANRLASNGLLEALVFGARAAADMDATLDAAPAAALKPITLADGTKGWSDEARLLKLEAVGALRRSMSRHCGVVRNAEGMAQALREIAEVEREAIGVSRSFLNMTVAATIVVAAALQRRESRGGHFRSDFPEANPARAERSRITWRQALALRAQHCDIEPDAE